MASDKAKASDLVALFLGAIVFTFGFLKFFDPFRAWFLEQITKSALPPEAIPLGIAGEIAIGLTLVGAFAARSRLGAWRHLVTAGACGGLIVMMLVATFVHLHPNVPADVLPLKIKPPVIPLSFLALSAWELVRAVREWGLEKGQ